MLEGLGGYMAERATAVRDVRARIVAELRGEQAPGIPERDEPFVLTAIDLAPADTATLNPTRVIALITSDGGPQSHTAILARQLGLPAIVAAKGIHEFDDGTEVFVDAGLGTITDEVTEEHHRFAAAWTELQENPLTYEGGGGVLADGTRVQLLANIGNAADAEEAAAAHADGVGLFRTEFLFLDRDEEPGVEEQAAAYAEVLRHFPGQKVVVRTIDAGADKPLPFLTDADEPNPALGVRAYRTSWEKRSVLTNQLDAIAAAAKTATPGGAAIPWVMAPMIATVEETEDFVALCTERGLQPAGIMVETPSAALIADRHLTVCDFASIGTNDLTQYTMAADRQLGSLAHLNSPWQPAVLALVGATCTGARTAGGDPQAYGEEAQRPVGVCGEAAGDPGLAVVLGGVGLALAAAGGRLRCGRGRPGTGRGAGRAGRQQLVDDPALPSGGGPGAVHRQPRAGQGPRRAGAGRPQRRGRPRCRARGPADPRGAGPLSWQAGALARRGRGSGLSGLGLWLVGDRIRTRRGLNREKRTRAASGRHGLGSPWTRVAMDGAHRAVATAQLPPRSSHRAAAL